jgi:NAD(P)-dependent dehydrogenase (short-subunit alcohol dehydrogenase family)
MKLENKIAIVTGAANGIGRAIALGLATGGAGVVIADVEIEPANELAGEIRTLGREAMTIEVDVANSKDTKRMVAATLDKFGAIDILVNNAGGPATGRQSLFHKSEEEVWDYVISLNLKGVRNCTRAVINHMIDRRRGKIINIASTSGVIGSTGMVDYSAAKAGIIGFSMALAKEVANYGINVNCVSPGPIQTRSLLSFPEKMEEAKQITGLGRVGRPEEVAAMVVFLASEDADFITGQNYLMCGLMNLGS